MRTLVIGDIHGNYKGLKQCLYRSKFDYENDKLICLGDVCDGWHEVRECFEELLKIKNLVYILGNHDDWALRYYNGELGLNETNHWLSQGGKNTIFSYGHRIMDDSHREILRNAKLYHIEYDYDDQIVFTHGGFEPTKPLADQDKDVFTWDRHLVEYARKKHNSKPDLKYGGYKEIYVGHTTTQLFKKDNESGVEPLNFCNLWMLDTGGGWCGKITIMDIKSKEFWQSDYSKDLYPGMIGR